MIQRLDPAAFDLIIRFEVGGGQSYYDKFLARPSWPGGASGVTIGVGYDLGYEEHFADDWQSRLPIGVFTRLARCLHKTGSVARQAISGVHDIEIPWESALEVFNDRSLPSQIRKTLLAFPHSADRLPAPAFGALVSLVFNRGPSLDHSDRRREMVAIHDAIEADRPHLCLYVATQLRNMKRLWKDDPDSDGDLFDRREAEAALVESCAQ
jgi:hypothetical protein